jgi:broad specificity phosphatase PhoE
MGLGDVILSSSLRDTDHRWAGVPFDEFLQVFNAGRTFADTRTLETLPDLAERMAATFTEITQAHPGGRVGILSHGDPLRALYHHLLHPEEALPGYPELCRLISLETAEGLRVEVDTAGQVEKIEQFK